MGTSLYLFVFLCLTSGLIDQSQAECCPRCQLCRRGWTKLGYKCFMFFNQKKSWGEAQLTCRMNGGTLASIYSTEEYNEIAKMIMYATNEDKRVWIGGHDLFRENHWEWSDGSLFAIHRWAANEPNNAGGSEHCMDFYGPAGFNDGKCNTLLPFVCSERQW